ncbi:penicillin-binding transpeptidase domain-containing protein [Kibdelosporangium phytohabitans]|uniref:Penicillin-binding protein transpeptidase domain-containing protein n=1 Tax=Kibdelosporangium phytohabitans TaxID=860235 RepID=A0A0N9HR57_9PSEU|nr:penicillin-binding transpeptidase domain-containing protein [Kibdelosporangium phytohabitans]ALG07267.1 hypothetical protein AOZ06_10345 [Kibdelosporangium phytohabitans]MBE1471872.1 membrane peptidoglycan carboxypeptidase [Kibdelosporangium phytohabitans]
MSKRAFGYAVTALLLVAGLIAAFMTMQAPPARQPAPPKPVRVYWADSTELDMADPAANLVWQQAKRELAGFGVGDKELANGYAVDLTIDPETQAKARRILDETLAGQPENLRTALVAVDPKTGRVVAYSGYSTRKPDVDFAASWQNTGGAFLPFVLVGLLKHKDRPLANHVYDGTSGRRFGSVLITNPPGPDCGRLCPVATAMKDDVYTVFADIAFNELGSQAVVNAAVASGMPDRIGDAGERLDGQLELGIALGGGKYVARPLDMAGAYATFAAGGVKHIPHLVAKVRNPENNTTVYDDAASAPPRPAYDTDDKKNFRTARTVTETLLPAGPPCAGNRPCAGKPGTHTCAKTEKTGTGDACATWMVGYTPQISTAVWVGSADSSALKDSAGNPLTGKGMAGKAWQVFMDDYLTGKPVEQFPPLS